MKLTSDQNLATTLWRPFNTLSITRILIAVILLILSGLNNSKYVWSIDLNIYRFVCSLYLFGAIVFAALQTKLKRYFFLQLSVQVTFDVIVISVLFFFGGGIGGGMGSSLVILYLFPLASCALLGPLTWALFLSSLVAVYILLISYLQVLGSGAETAVSSSGLCGAAFLAMVYGVNRLANRLISQEELTLHHKKNLRIQQEINNLVVADMSDGIIVVDGATCVYAFNSASTQMLGISLVPGVTKLSDVPGMHPVVEAFFFWRSRAAKLEPVCINTISMSREATLSSPVMIKGMRRDVVAHLKIRFVIVNSESGINDERCIIYLQDAFEIENRAQQLKLASMGRLTASIAHEVRNPLSSISYAVGLLGESGQKSEQTERLVKIVSENVVRLNQLIEDILRLSRKAQMHVEPFSLKRTLQEIVQEFQETHSEGKLAPDIIQIGVPDALMIRFDPVHLREVLVNLLSNAIRYAGDKAGSIQLFVIDDSPDHVELHVHDDGPGIAPEVRAHLFEPFYTTSSCGTGLGLYIARELCLNNRALLDYEYRVTEMVAGIVRTVPGAMPKGRFVITLVKPEQLSPI